MTRGSGLKGLISFELFGEILGKFQKMAGIRNFSATFLKVAAKLQQNSIDLSNPRISVKFRGKSTQTRRNLNDFSDISAELLNVPKKRTISEFWKWHWNNGVELEKAAY